VFRTRPAAAPAAEGATPPETGAIPTLTVPVEDDQHASTPSEGSASPAQQAPRPSSPLAQDVPPGFDQAAAPDTDTPPPGEDDA
ncbi:MAG: hypothetical protein OER86_14455, partial [Phycisphaerae bacterium]|nr:hypothetical protein [Phycisphaerae bacterium]